MKAKTAADSEEETAEAGFASAAFDLVQLRLALWGQQVVAAIGAVQQWKETVGALEPAAGAAPQTLVHRGTAAAVGIRHSATWEDAAVVFAVGKMAEGNPAVRHQTVDEMIPVDRNQVLAFHTQVFESRLGWGRARLLATRRVQCGAKFFSVIRSCAFVMICFVQ